MSEQVSAPAIIYAAKSTEDRGGSIPTQVEDARALAAREGLTVEGVHVEEAVSAYHGSRGPELLAAREHAERLAREHGSCALIVQHSDRLARGDGIAAQHLVEVVLWARKVGVTIRSVQDDQTGENLLMAALMGERNYEDSHRRSQAITAGIRRTVVDRGQWRGGKLPLGYDVLRDYDANGRPTRTLVKHEGDQAAIELIWALALDGVSVPLIGVELSRRGMRARSLQGKGQPRPFDALRIWRVLDNPFYAGQLRIKGEVVQGVHPRYVEPEAFYRLKHERSRQPKRAVGRPVETALLSRLVRCLHCDEPMILERKRRKGGAYVCKGHRERHRDNPDRCPVLPFDADAVDRLVLAGLDGILSDGGRLREQLLAGQRAEIERLEGVAREANEEVQAAARAVERARREVAERLDYDEDDRRILLDAAKLREGDGERAQARLEAALDAITAAQAEPQPQSADEALARLYDALGGPMTAHRSDAKALNLALAQWFSAFYVGRRDDELIVQPLLRVDAADRLLGRTREQETTWEQRIERYESYAPEPLTETLHLVK